MEPVNVAAAEMVMDEPLATAVTVVEAGMPEPVTVKPGWIWVKRVGSALVTVVLPDVVEDTMLTDPTEAPVWSLQTRVDPSLSWVVSSHTSTVVVSGFSLSTVLQIPSRLASR